MGTNLFGDAKTSSDIDWINDNCCNEYGIGLLFEVGINLFARFNELIVIDCVCNAIITLAP